MAYVILLVPDTLFEVILGMIWLSCICSCLDWGTRELYAQ